jgi:hypothetical protein
MKVEWRHELEDEPVLLVSEVSNGYETRKVEIYRDGRTDHADGNSSTGSTRLGNVLMPTSQEISSDEQFVAEDITGQEFEEVWKQALGK